MNCSHHNIIFGSCNELICTACSPDFTVAKCGDEANKAMKSTTPAFGGRKLFTSFQNPDPHCEQVLFTTFWKNHVQQKIRRDANFFRRQNKPNQGRDDLPVVRLRGNAALPIKRPPKGAAFSTVSKRRVMPPLARRSARRVSWPWPPAFCA
jgi:hypothetical protein